MLSQARHDQVLRTRLKKRADMKAQANGTAKSQNWTMEAQRVQQQEEDFGTPMSDMVTSDMKRREALNSIAPSNPSRSGAASALSGPIRPVGHGIRQELRSSSALDFHETLPQI